MFLYSTEVGNSSLTLQKSHTSVVRYCKLMDTPLRLWLAEIYTLRSKLLSLNHRTRPTTVRLEVLNYWQHSCKEIHACSPGCCSRSAIVAGRTCRCFLHVQDEESRMCSGSVQLLRGHATVSQSRSPPQRLLILLGVVSSLEIIFRI